MSFQFGGQIKQFFAAQADATQFAQPGQDAHANGCAVAEAAGNWDVT